MSGSRFVSTTAKLKQQELEAWQPIVTPAWVISTFFIIGILFIPVGVRLIHKANNNFEIVAVYDNGKLAESDPDSSYIDCKITEINEGYKDILNNRPRECEVKFVIPIDVDITTDIYLYFELENFYQNHRRYVQSRSDQQLKGDVKFSSNINSIIADVESDCDPEESVITHIETSSTLGKDLVYYPCGLIALSYFNDGIQRKQFKRANSFNLTWINNVLVQSSNTSSPTEVSDVYLDDVGIAWQSDLSNRFKNPTRQQNYPHYESFQYLWQTYDQFSCYSAADPNIRTECLKWTDIAKIEQPDSTILDFEIPGSGCAKCVSSSDHFINEGGIPAPDDFTNPLSNNGLRYEKFVVWMRTAALPNFRKLFSKLKIRYSNIVSPLQQETTTIEEEISEDIVDSRKLISSSQTFGFKKGDEIVFKIVPNFLVSEFNGQKKLVLSTIGPLKSRNKSLGIAYVIIGTVALLLAILIALKLKFRPRKLGDPKYLHLKHS